MNVQPPPPCQLGARIAVTGATGLIGRAVCDHLEQVSGFTVAALVRDSRPRGSEIKPVRPDGHGVCEDKGADRPFDLAQGRRPIFRGDLATGDFRPFLSGCTGLVHCAFSHVPGKYRGGEGGDPLKFWELNLIGTLRLLEHARLSGVRRVVLLSSRAVYAKDDFRPGQQIDETHHPRPDTHYGAQKMALEALASAYTTPDFGVSALRLTGVYGGPKEMNKWRQLFINVSMGLLPARNRTATEVHIQTVVEAISILLTHAFAAGKIFNLSEVRVSCAQILQAAGFKGLSLPVAEAMHGPELTCAAIKSLGLVLRDEGDLAAAALDLRAQLKI